MHIGSAVGFYAGILAKQGICCIGIDQRGFGKSEGAQGYI